MFGLRKRFEDLRKKQNKPNRSPHKVPPKVGCYPSHGDVEERFPCQRCECEVDVNQTVVEFNLKTTFTVLYDHFDVFFPVSECGNVTDFSCTAFGFRLRGELLREKDGRYFPPSDPRFDEEDEQTKQSRGGSTEPARRSSTKRKGKGGGTEEDPPALYYFIVRDVPSQLSQLNIKRGIKAELRIKVKTEAFPKDDIISVPFPLSVCPRSPDEFKYKIQMQKNIRRMFSPNKSHGIFPYVNGKRADCTLDIGPETRMRMEDYLFILQIELGEPIVPQCADPVTLLILVSAAAAMLFFTLTRDLEEY